MTIKKIEKRNSKYIENVFDTYWKFYKDTVSAQKRILLSLIKIFYLIFQIVIYAKKLNFLLFPLWYVIVLGKIN